MWVKIHWGAVGGDTHQEIVFRCDELLAFGIHGILGEKTEGCGWNFLTLDDRVMEGGIMSHFASMCLATAAQMLHPQHFFHNLFMATVAEMKRYVARDPGAFRGGRVIRPG